MSSPTQAEVVLMFLPAAEGGRQKAIALHDGSYSAQLLVAGAGPLGVTFVAGPVQAVRPGETAAATVSFTGPPETSHAAVTEGTAFKAMAGGRLVAIGRVVRLIKSAP
jgi:translation elongation factor EF-Tu-like GTPase